uniref:Uncharacterized protein n=1 Tax=Arundo donax TaxID=35708 RepID=A0A0A9GWD8_ARUDO
MRYLYVYVLQFHLHHMHSDNNVLLLCASSSDRLQSDTGLSRGFPAKKASRFPATMSRTPPMDSGVSTALWSDSTTFSIPNSSGGTSGSFSYTSSPAPAMTPSRRHRTSSGSSTSPPRPTLTSTPFFPSASITSRFTTRRVSSVSAHDSTSTSLSAARSRTVAKNLYGADGFGDREL